MEKFKVAVVIPCYNEQKTLIKLIKSINKFADPLVVDDASIDRTAKILKELKINFITNNKNIGYEKSVMRGLKYAKKNGYKFIITCDADGQHKVKDIKKIIQFLNKNKFDCIYGVRHRFQRFSEFIFSKVSQFLYQLEDPLCGLKGYNSKILNLSKKFHNSICTELLFDIKRRNLLIKAIPIKTNTRKDNPRFGGILISNYKIFNSVINIIKNYYFIY